MLLLYLALIDDEADKNKFEALYHLYRNQMYWIANHILQDSYEAEDAVHNAFLAIAQHMDRVGAPDASATKSYLFTIVKNQALNLLPQKKQHDNLIHLEDIADSRDIDSIDSVLDSYCTKENFDNVVAAIHQLEEPYCSVLFLRFLNGLNLKEIAKLLDQRYDAVKKQFSRGKRRLIILLRQQNILPYEKAKK